MNRAKTTHNRPASQAAAVVLSAAALSCALGLPSSAAAQEPRPDPKTGLYSLAAGGYPLDAIERVLAPKGKVRCPTVEKTRYPGDVIPYHSKVMVARPFVGHLRAFERLVAEVAVRHYGRAPRKLRHIGTYNCRRIRQWPTFLSEHGLANGIDVAGFDFGPAPRAERAALPKALRGAFTVRVRKHWRSERAADARHRAFWHDLGRELVAAKHIFRVVLGPGYPGHEDHLHLDLAPWRLVEIDLDATDAEADPNHAPGGATE
ncbi:MAG: extensin family protein [Deltaproteobacteria bacterium]|nr:extensin family protein [Deltaproteobacteria bacterium]